MTFAASVTPKIAAAGASIHGNRVITFTFAASASIVPQVGVPSRNPRPMNACIVVEVLRTVEGGAYGGAGSVPGGTMEGSRWRSGDSDELVT